MKEQKVFEIIEIPKEIKDKFPTLRNIKRIRISSVQYTWGVGTEIDGEKWEPISYNEMYYIFKLRNYICKGVMEKFTINRNEDYWCRNHTDDNFRKATGEFRGLLAKIHFGCDAVSDKITYEYRNERRASRNVIFAQYENKE